MLKTESAVDARVEFVFVDRERDERVFFIATPENTESGGNTILFHSHYHRPPVLVGDEIVPGGNDPGDNLTDIEIGTILHGVCEFASDGRPRARCWCRSSEFIACKDELAQRQEELQEFRAAEAHRLAAFERKAANPRTYDEALRLGWEDVTSPTDLGPHNRQRILERQFAGEAGPRRLTKHLPPANGKCSKRSLDLVS